MQNITRATELCVNPATQGLIDHVEIGIIERFNIVTSNYVPPPTPKPKPKPNKPWYAQHRKDGRHGRY